MSATQFQNYLARWVAWSQSFRHHTYVSSSWAAVLYLAVVGGIGYYLCAKHALLGFSNLKPTKEDYQKVYNEIAGRLEEDYHYDDGSYVPILVRLAWHASGTYDTKTDTGGSNGATMRVCPESFHGANAGLDIARNFLEDVKSK